ncbi:uncharacterized protein [Neodiprion pinetum]|uniref:uncharacterized protein isoform X1 n=1 Tax=Neodiprion pinetum TaxID=441929 RepID=UPI001EDD40B3|nr:uncharacterized protein LOC124212569 isoform X1 [Neodiprion pinetum]
MTIRCYNRLSETTIRENGFGNVKGSNFQCTEVSPASSKTFDVDGKSMTKLSCPFTWDMGKIMEIRVRLLNDKSRFEDVTDTQDQFPEFVLIYHLMLAYENVSNENPQAAIECIKGAENSFLEIKQRKTLESVERVLKHILFGTKYYVLQQMGQLTQADELLKEICNIKDMNETELAMLSGCQCLAWSLYNVTDNSMAIKFAQEAVQHEPSNGKWHFLVGKNCRTLRKRNCSTDSLPDEHESFGFQKAYELSKNALFGVYLARMYRESKNTEEANRMYKQVAAGERTCCKVQLQLALGLVRAKDCSLAKSCLDYVAERMPDSPKYAHYMAIYEEKCNRDFKAALRYYTTAIEEGNFQAEWQYIECRKKVEPDWNPLPYMLELLTKYNKDPDAQIQEINIKIGVYYLFHMDDVLSASPYLDNAVQIDPNAKSLKTYFVSYQNNVNVYYAWAVKIRLALLMEATKLSTDKKAMLKDKLQLCSENDQISSSISGDSEQTLNQLWSEMYQNYHNQSSGGNSRQQQINRRNYSEGTRQPKHL